MIRLKTKEELTLEKIRKPIEIAKKYTMNVTSEYTEKSKSRLIEHRIILTSGCWIWNGAKDDNGYGRIGFAYETWLVHRLSFHLFKPEEFKENLHTCHKCDTPSCFNPEHLYSGTDMDNKQDEVRKGKIFNSRKRFCPKGHEYTPDNIYKNGTGRKCKICTKNRSILQYL